MFFLNFKYTLKALLGNKSLIFWTLAFPLIMALFFNMAFSNGLRALHDQGVIQLLHKLDGDDIWFLYESELHSVKSTVTHIAIRG